MKAPRSLPSFNSVSAGQTATLNLPVTGVYDTIIITYGTSTAGGANQANMEAELTEWRLKVNDKVQRRFSSEDLFDINYHKGMGLPADGEVTIHLAEPWRRSAQGEDVLGWGMGDVNSFQIEVDIASGATSPTLSAKCVRQKATRPMGPIVKWRKHSVPVTATGINNVTTLNKGDEYVAMHAKSSVIDDVEVKVGEAEEWKATAAECTRLQDFYGRIPVAGWFHIPFDVSNRVLDTLKIGKDPQSGQPYSFQVDFNMNTATPFTLLTETLGLRD